MPSSFSAPGFADELNPGLLSRRNAVIDAEFDRAEKEPGSESFAVHSTDSTALPHAVPWFRNPAEPEFRAVVTAPGSKGRMRPERVRVTTELFAEDGPDLLRETLTETLGHLPPRWQELYGPVVANPKLLLPAQRRVAFARRMTGHGKHTDLATAGVPGDPGSSLNAVNALFMAHPINGLDDLIYLVVFGAKPYAGRTAAGELEAAGRDQTFRQESDREQPACRNTGPATALAATGAACTGRTVSFANPLGVYIHPIHLRGLPVRGRPLDRRRHLPRLPPPRSRPRRPAPPAARPTGAACRPRQAHRRANLTTTAAPELDGSLRVFRQGHEFFEPIPASPRFRVWLNLVGSQDSPDRVLRILTQRARLWGQLRPAVRPGRTAGQLLTVRAGGTCLLPPRHDAAPDPGSEVFA
jgi:hypothetical protein